jgi:hypothetical protein
LTTTTTTIIPPSPRAESPPSSTPVTSIHSSLIMDSFVFDDYSKKVNQVSQFMMENKFFEAIRRLIEYGNREFLRSFQLRSEVKEGSNGNGNGNNNNIITTYVATLIPPFETIGFLEAKWLEVLKELVEYGNKNILGNFMLYLVMEEKKEVAVICPKAHAKINIPIVGVYLKISFFSFFN